MLHRSNLKNDRRKPLMGASLSEVNRYVVDKYIKKKYVKTPNINDPLTAYKKGEYMQAKTAEM